MRTGRCWCCQTWQSSWTIRSSETSAERLAQEDERAELVAGEAAEPGDAEEPGRVQDAHVGDAHRLGVEVQPVQALLGAQDRGDLGSAAAGAGHPPDPRWLPVRRTRGPGRRRPARAARRPTWCPRASRPARTAPRRHAPVLGVDVEVEHEVAGEEVLAPAPTQHRSRAGPQAAARRADRSSRGSGTYRSFLSGGSYGVALHGSAGAARCVWGEDPKRRVTPRARRAAAPRGSSARAPRRPGRSRAEARHGGRRTGRCAPAPAPRGSAARARPGDGRR